ncbi:GNAT family acetyltransferase [Methylococcus sp. EFPC2]|uniref:GNAT family acetyltransferase n=1 Tax=Methylococcus sp. EFPC2 TaxID=2812648 RepID=UPI0019685BBD|nr:GNAT family acetyltransferase [Methylococcus sp. EFPC2]QSA97181.1 GNAT family acetyltransferase [Methylococcus sp. EFPC2]
MIRSYESADESAVIELWRRCELIRPWNDPHKDIRRKLTTQAELFLVGVLYGEIVGTAMAGYDGHRGWVNYLAVDPEHRRAGIGRRLMRRAEENLTELGCPKLNLQVRTGNHEVLEFYRRLGYRVDEVVSLGKRLISDTPEV